MQNEIPCQFPAEQIMVPALLTSRTWTLCTALLPGIHCWLAAAAKETTVILTDLNTVAAAGAHKGMTHEWITNDAR